MFAAAGVASLARGTDDKNATAAYVLGDPVVTQTTSLNPKASAAVVSADKRAMGIIFGDPKLGDLQIGLGKLDKVLSAVKMVTFHVPVQPPADRSMIGYRQVIRGVVDKGEGSRVVIVADFAGTTKVIEYPYGEGIQEPQLRARVRQPGREPDDRHR